MNKRVHEIAKERGLQSKEVIEKLRAAGIDVKAASSNVDEAQALRVLGNGDGAGPTADAARGRACGEASCNSAAAAAAASGTAAHRPRVLRSGHSVRLSTSGQRVTRCRASGRQAPPVAAVAW